MLFASNVWLSVVVYNIVDREFWLVLLVHADMELVKPR